MSALIRKSNIRKVASKIFKGKSSEKKEILGNVKTSGISERKFGILLKKEYGYKPERRRRIINVITREDKKKDKPREMTWAQKMRQKEEQHKTERKEMEKQRKLEAIEEEKRAKRAKASGLMARRMEDSPQGKRMNFINRPSEKKAISQTRKGSGFAGNLANPSSSASANKSSGGGFAGGGPTQNRDNFFHQN